MTELLSLDLVKKGIVTSQLVLDIGYDIENLTNPFLNNLYNGEITLDRYGRKVPKHAHGTINIDHKTSSSKILIEEILKLYDRIINKNLLVRRINITANNVVTEESLENNNFEQLDLFINYDEINKKRKKEKDERNIQKAIIQIKEKYGKNAILKGMNFQEEGTTIDRNNQIGGHKA